MRSVLKPLHLLTLRSNSRSFILSPEALPLPCISACLRHMASPKPQGAWAQQPPSTGLGAQEQGAQFKALPRVALLLVARWVPFQGYTLSTLGTAFVIGTGS